MYECTHLEKEFITAAHMALKSQIGLGSHMKHFQSCFFASNSDRLTFLFIHP